MASFDFLTNRKWQPGSYTFPSGGQFAAGLSIPLGIEYVKLTLDVTDMLDSANVVMFAAEVSFDGGVTWRREGAAFQGGPIRMTDLGGAPIIRTPPFVSYHEFHFPEPGNSNRRVRVTLTLIGPATKLSSTVETR